MRSVDSLITSLSEQATPVAPLRSPRYWGGRVLAVLVLYALLTQWFLGLRPDLALQFTRPLFALEIILLGVLVVSSSLAAVLSMYPDAYQKPHLLRVPFAVFTGLVVLMGVQVYMPASPMMVLVSQSQHAMECALCIASVALVPSAVLFGLLRKGANVHPLQAGAFAVLAASGVGGLTLRLAEDNDSITHLLTWHYAPTLLFAAVGALVGRWILRW